MNIIFFNKSVVTSSYLLGSDTEEKGGFLLVWRMVKWKNAEDTLR